MICYFQIYFIFKVYVLFLISNNLRKGPLASVVCLFVFVADFFIRI